MRKRVAFIANSLDNAYKFQRVLSEMEADIAVSSTSQLETLLEERPAPDLVVFEAMGTLFLSLENVAMRARKCNTPVLAIIDEHNLENPFPQNGVSYDFVVNGAGITECAMRVSRLLGGGRAKSAADVLNVDDMCINLNTYQVTVAEKPVDFTYLEYALLAFFVKHPGRAFSRDALLNQVWGLDYYGGSRTVDVHVRRIRAKLGPNLAQRLETVRGVGYLWSND